MEDDFDLFQLNLSPELEDNPYNHYTSNEFGWTVELERSHYSQFKEKLDKIILARENKKSTAKLQRDLEKLRIVWSHVSPILRAESNKLLRLPREIRDQIYTELYIEPTPLNATENTLGSWKKQRLYSPPDALGRLIFESADERYIDRPLYLNASVVHPDIAAEAAELFYNNNTFDFDDYLPRRFSKFLATDHFESGVLPRDIISTLHLKANLIGDHHCELQDGGLDYLKPIFSMPNLRKIHLTLVFGYYFSRDIARMPALGFRGLAEDLKRLTVRGVDVQVSLEHSRINPAMYDEYLDRLGESDEETQTRPENADSYEEWDMPAEMPQKDITCWFDMPNEKDLETARQLNGVHVRDGKLVWGVTPNGYKIGDRHDEIMQQYRIWLSDCQVL